MPKSQFRKLVFEGGESKNIAHPGVFSVSSQRLRALDARDAYHAAARKKLRALVSWLETNSHEDAAASLREGL